MTVTKLVRNDIPSTQENLMKWALDNGYSPVTSYTIAPVANRFHLRLENNGKCDVSHLLASVFQRKLLSEGLSFPCICCWLPAIRLYNLSVSP